MKNAAAASSCFFHIKKINSRLIKEYLRKVYLKILEYYYVIRFRKIRRKCQIKRLYQILTFLLHNGNETNYPPRRRQLSLSGGLQSSVRQDGVSQRSPLRLIAHGITNDEGEDARTKRPLSQMLFQVSSPTMIGGDAHATALMSSGSWRRILSPVAIIDFRLSRFLEQTDAAVTQASTPTQHGGTSRRSLAGPSSGSFATAA